MASAIENTLIERLAPLEPKVLLLRDDSHLHAGHAGARDGGHYQLTLVSEHFVDLGRLARHREVMRYLSDLIPSPIHALSVRALAPAEYSALN